MHQEWGSQRGASRWRSILARLPLRALRLKGVLKKAKRDAHCALFLMPNIHPWMFGTTAMENKFRSRCRS